MYRTHGAYIYSFILTSLVISTLVSCHDENENILHDLQERTDEIGEGYEIIHELIQSLNDTVLEGGIPEPRKNETVSLNVKNFIDRLDTLESNIAAIESYVQGERETDTFLRGLSGAIGQAFDDTMQEVKQLADGLRNELKESFVNVNQELTEVEEFSNSRNVIIGGILYYDGIGSACGSSFDVCHVENSACRDDKYQCKLGLSYDGLQQSCVDRCERGYGNTYQTVYNYIIRDNNYDTVNGTSLKECQQRCETDEAFLCRSFDYFPRWNTCYLSEHTKSDADEWWEYNSAGIHFQRDCVIDKNTK